MTKLRIATRESPLALWQANHVKSLLENQDPSTQCEIVGMTTAGDRNKVSPLSQMGGKGVFVKELENALFTRDVDIAVHSMKDVPGVLPTGLRIGGMVERASPLDAFVSNRYERFEQLPEGAIVGSSSLRRVLQLKRVRPDLSFRELRGNVETRLRKLDAAEYDAIILAVAGLSRLGLADRIASEISSEDCLPAAGQGAVGIECRDDDQDVLRKLQRISDEQTVCCVGAERCVTQILEATCNLPVAVFAELQSGDEISIRAYLSDVRGERVLYESRTGLASDAMSLAGSLGEALLKKGARDLMLDH